MSQRLREVAIRLALGARPLDVRALIVRQGMSLLVVVAVVASYGPTRRASHVDPIVALRR